MSSVFSFDNWDALLGSTPTPTLSASSSAVPSGLSGSTPTSQASSGESSGLFQPFVAIGSAVSVGVGKKSCFLFSGASPDKLCLGMIGSSKFCLKSCGELNTCGVQSHEVKKFSPAPHDFYLKENEGRAFIKPALSGPELSMVDVQKILAKHLPLKEWEMIFADLQAGNFPEWLDGFCGISTRGLLDKASSEDSLDELSASTVLELDSPRISSGIFSVLPALSFDDEVLDDLEEEAEVDSVPLQKVFSVVKENCKRFSRLKLKWSQSFAEVEASHLVVVKDLQKLKNSTVALRNLLGKPDPINDNERPSLWCGLRYLSKLQSLSGLQASSQNALETLQRNQLGLKQSMSVLGEEHENFQNTTGDRLAQIERCLTTFEQCFTKILPILLSVKPQNKSPTQEPELQAFKMQLQEMEAKVLSLQEILSFVLLSPCTDEYSHDLMHQKKAMVMRSAIVVEIVASDNETLALRWISLYTDTGRAFWGIGLGSVFFMPLICCCRRGWMECPSEPW
jgi:hypothetical protein